MTSTPTSVNDGPYTTNYLASSSFLFIYIINIWTSVFLLFSTFLLYCYLTYHNIYLFIFFLPFEVFLSYFLIVFTALFISKLFLIFVNLIHKPKEGVFKREKSDRDYYYWSLRAVIKKWPIWLSSLLPSSVLINLLLTVFGIETSFTNSINKANIGTEFIEIGKHTVIGKGSFVKSSMVFQNYLIIKKIKIEDHVIIAPHSFISPGTIIRKGATVNTLSVTKFDQTLAENSIYSGYPAEKVGVNQRETGEISETNIDDLWESIMDNKPPNSRHEKETYNNSETKFIKKTPTYIALFALIYFMSYFLPLFCLILYFKELFIPFVFISAYFPYIRTFILIITPALLLALYGLNILLCILVSKCCFIIICKFDKPKEGEFHWKNKTKSYEFYFIRSFLLRYVKWKVQRSPFPWLIKAVFNFIGNCCFQKGVVIEDLYLGKEFIEVGENVYLGKCLLSNQTWDQDLTIKGVKIGDNVVISDGCCIPPGNDINENTTILPFSITSKDSHLVSNSVYYGAPIKKIHSKQNLIEILNLKVHSDE